MAMTLADQYRVKAGDLASRARAEKDLFQKAEYERLSLSYLRLADQADRNSQNDVASALVASPLFGKRMVAVCPKN